LSAGVHLVEGEGRPTLNPEHLTGGQMKSLLGKKKKGEWVPDPFDKKKKTPYIKGRGRSGVAASRPKISRRLGPPTR